MTKSAQSSPQFAHDSNDLPIALFFLVAGLLRIGRDASPIDVTISTKLLLASSLVVGLAGCDTDESAAPLDYKAVAHVDLDAASSAPWVKALIADTKFDIDPDGKLGPCAAVLDAATAITGGGSEDEFEVYISGNFDADETEACIDFAEDKAAKRTKKRRHDNPEFVMLSSDLIAVHSDTVAPSRSRMESLLASDPSPSGQPMWVIAQPDGKKGKQQVSHVQAWASTAGGLDVQAQVEFADEAQATELYGKAMLGLTALQLSGEVALADGLNLDRSGDTLSASVKLTPKVITKLVKETKEEHSIRHGHSEGGKDGHHVQIKFQHD